MEIGTGIVVATTLAIAAWQVDKRQAWRKARNFALALVVLALLAGGGVWAYSKYESRQAALRAAAEARNIRDGNITALAGVALGDVRQKVEYAWGLPDSDKDGVVAWRSTNSDRAVLFSKAGVARVILCGKADSIFAFDCGEVAGIRIGSEEAEVAEVLGPPARPPAFEGGEKTLSYGGRVGLDVVLESGRVARFVLYEPRDKMSLAKQSAHTPRDGTADTAAAETGPWTDYPSAAPGE